MGLEVYKNGEIIFSSSSKWLFPLFELEDYLKENPSVCPSDLNIHDTVQGKAAAVLTWKLGIRRVDVDLMSSLATDFYEAHNVKYSYQTLIPKILCATEDLLSSELDVQEAYRLLSARAGRNV